MTETIRPSLGLAFEPLTPPAPTPSAPPVRAQQAAVREAAETLSRANGAPAEPKPKKRPGRPRSAAPEPTAEAKPEWRRRPGRPRSSRRHALTLKSTERHLRFLYALTEVEDGLLVEAVEDGLVALAERVLREGAWRGHALSEEARDLAEELTR